MKGRSPFNRPSVKKADLYKLLLSLGGKARWKQLRGKLKDLTWGPTTLKKTLDQMVTEGKIKKEAVAGDKGPEVWYSLTQEGKHEIVNSIVGDHAETIKILKEVFATMDPVEAHVILGELKRSLLNVVTFVDDVYSLLPKDADLIDSTEPPEERKRRRAFYTKTGGKINVQIRGQMSPKREKKGGEKR